MTYAALLSLALTVQSAAPATPSTEALGRAYYLYIDARLLESSGDVAGAIAAYRQAIALLPQSTDLHADLAELYLREGQVTEAQAEAERAVEASPSNPDAHRLLGWIQANTLEANVAANDPKLAQAIDHLERAFAGGVTDVNAELILGDLYTRRGDPAQAVVRIQKVLAVRPEFPPALRLLAKAYMKSGANEDVAKTLDLLSQTDPDQIELFVRQIGQIERVGRWDQAALMWGTVMQRDPGGSIYRARYAEALLNSGRVPQARTTLLDATRDSPKDIAAWYLLAQVEARLNNPTAADAAAKKVAEIDPKDSRGPLGLAFVRAARQDYRGVISALESRVASPEPDDVTSGAFAEMAGELRYAFGKTGQNKRAVEMLEGARKRAPKDQGLLFSLAAAYEQDHRYDQAERAFRELIAADASHADALNYLGYMLADRGQKLPEAVDLINRALKIDEGNPSFLDSLGWAYYKMGQYDNARQPLERAATALPKVSVIQDHLGDLYLQLKRYDDAIKAFESALAGDRDGIDAAAITKKRDRARSLAGKS